MGPHDCLLRRSLVVDRANSVSFTLVIPGEQRWHLRAPSARSVHYLTFEDVTFGDVSRP